MMKSPKSALMNHLESRIATNPPSSIDVQVIDAAFFLHLCSDLPQTFDGVARVILKKVLQSDGKIIHFVSDKWITPSIKDSERSGREASSGSAANFGIIGGKQTRPSNWIAALRCNNFKSALIKFLISSWKNDSYSSMFEGKVLYANVEDTCYSFRSVLDKVVRKEELTLYSTHEEADSRMFFHVSSVQAPANVVVRTCDTDCLVIGIGCRSNLDSGLKIWIETGLQTKSTLRYISIDQICDDLGESLCRALPAYHAFTGCDYTSSFCRRGNVQPFKKLEKDAASQLAFSRLGKEDLENLDEVFPQLEQFASSMYTKKKIKKINEVRTDLFLQKYKHKDEEKISCAKKLDGSTLPPCSRVLYKKCKRTWYVARLWMSSTSAIPDARKPEDYGWTLQDGAYKIIWFEGDASPRALDIVCEENSQTDEQADESEGMSETMNS